MPRAWQFLFPNIPPAAASSEQRASNLSPPFSPFPFGWHFCRRFWRLLKIFSPLLQLWSSSSRSTQDDLAGPIPQFITKKVPSLAGASARYPRSLQVTGHFLPLLSNHDSLSAHRHPSRLEEILFHLPVPLRVAVSCQSYQHLSFSNLRSGLFHNIGGLLQVLQSDT